MLRLLSLSFQVQSLRSKPSPKKSKDTDPSKERDAVDKILAQWHQKRPDLDVSPMGLIGRTTRLASYLRKAIGKTFAEYGLQPGEFDVMATLRRSGAPYQLSPTELFKTMMVSSGTMTNRIDRLEDAGLVESIPDERDR